MTEIAELETIIATMKCEVSFYFSSRNFCVIVWCVLKFFSFKKNALKMKKKF